jgi:hypothetical protein
MCVEEHARSIVWVLMSMASWVKLYESLLTYYCCCYETNVSFLNRTETSLSRGLVCVMMWSGVVWLP